MTRKFILNLSTLVVILTLSLLSLVACTSSQTKSDFLNAGNSNLSVTGAQFDQYTLFRFDTSGSAHTLALPSAADIVANLSSPYIGSDLSCSGCRWQQRCYAHCWYKRHD